MNINKIRETFESFGYKGNSQINQTKLNEILESLMVVVLRFSQASHISPMTKMLLMSCGNRPRVALTSLRLTEFARLLTTESISFSPSSKRSMVMHLRIRVNKDPGERKK